MNCEWQNSECDTESKTQQKATEIAQRFIDHFVDLTLPGEACSQNTKRLAIIVNQFNQTLICKFMLYSK